jgi:RNA polymerase sigma-70 factor (ECF subfamily)
MSLLTSIEDRRMAGWARHAAAGDRRAFARLYQRLYPTVMAYVHRRIHNAADAEDLGSKIFVRIVEHLARYDAQRGTVRAWALTIARHQVIDHLRTRRQVVALDEVARPLADATASPDDHLLHDERMAALRAAVAQLPEADRELFALRYGDGLRLAEIAVVSELSIDAVKQRFSRALRKLRAAHDRALSPGAKTDRKAAGYAI